MNELLIKKNEPKPYFFQNRRTVAEPKEYKLDARATAEEIKNLAQRLDAVETFLEDELPQILEELKTQATNTGKEEPPLNQETSADVMVKPKQPKDKKQLAMELHTAGQSLREIASKMSVDCSTVSRWITKQRAMQEYHNQNPQQVNL